MYLHYEIEKYNTVTKHWKFIEDDFGNRYKATKFIHAVRRVQSEPMGKYQIVKVTREVM